MGNAEAVGEDPHLHGSVSAAGEDVIGWSHLDLHDSCPQVPEQRLASVLVREGVERALSGEAPNLRSADRKWYRSLKIWISTSSPLSWLAECCRERGWTSEDARQTSIKDSNAPVSLNVCLPRQPEYIFSDLRKMFFSKGITLYLLTHPYFTNLQQTNVYEQIYIFSRNRGTYLDLFVSEVI